MESFLEYRFVPTCLASGPYVPQGHLVPRVLLAIFFELHEFRQLGYGRSVGGVFLNDARLL